MSEMVKWVSVGALGEAFQPDNNSLKSVQDLAGRRLTLHFEDGRKEVYRFLDAQALCRQGTDARGADREVEEVYTVTCPRPGIYFVDFIESGKRAASRSLALDFNRGVVTAVAGTLPTRLEAKEPLLEKIAQGACLTGVTADFARGTIDRPCTPDAPLHPETAELIGKRVQYVYSSTETYEHIYLNRSFYTWHCTQGIERGLCDTDLCHYYRIADNLFLFVWREKIVPTLGVVMIDLQRMKTTGKIFGYRGDDFQELTNFAMGAFASIVNVVPPGFGP